MEKVSKAWRVEGRERVRCKPKSKPIPAVQSQKGSRIQDTGTSKSRGQSETENRRMAWKSLEAAITPPTLASVQKARQLPRNASRNVEVYSQEKLPNRQDSWILAQSEKKRNGLQ